LLEADELALVLFDCSARSWRAMGTACSPNKMPRSPIKAIVGGAGDVAADRLKLRFNLCEAQIQFVEPLMKLLHQFVKQLICNIGHGTLRDNLYAISTV
jgi:hypothetical protein